MKSAKLLTGLFAATLATQSFGAVFEITGATAFRKATIQSITALYVASGQPFRFAHNKVSTDYENADQITFEGTVNVAGLGAGTVIRCSFNGSIEGLRAIADSPASDPNFIKQSALTATAIVGGANEPLTLVSGQVPAAQLETAEAEIAFSDTNKAISPYASYPMAPTNASVGVVVFSMLASDGSTISNVTTQQYNSLLENGIVPKSVFTGDPADLSKYVICTGRNDGSGTRSSYLTEMGWGAANPVQQYLVVGSTSSSGTTPDRFTAVQRVPAGGLNIPVGSALATFDVDPGTAGIQAPSALATSASTVWGQDVNGNGGAFSGSVLRGHMALKGTGVRVFDTDGSDLYGATVEADLVTWLSLNDAVTARTNGARICAFNGVKLDDIALAGTTMSTADKNKVYYGAYSAWNFQQMVRRMDASSATVTLYDQIKNAIPTNLGSAGLTLGSMQVLRALDGGPISPKSL